MSLYMASIINIIHLCTCCQTLFNIIHLCNNDYSSIEEIQHASTFVQQHKLKTQKAVRNIVGCKCCVS